MFKILIRNVAKNKVVSAINILGLTLGISVACMMMLYVKHESSYDKYHSNGDQIFRIAQEQKTKSGTTSLAMTPLALATTLSELPGIESSARLLRESGSILVYGDKLFNEAEFCFTDPQITEIFNLEFIAGNPKSAFTDRGLVITEKIAKKYFGKEDPIGKSILYRNWGTETPLQVTGVIKDLPTQSHFKFEVFAKFESSFNLWDAMHGKDWFHSGAWTYIRVKNPETVQTIAHEINQVALKNLPQELKPSVSFFLQPLFDIHLHSDLTSEIETNNSSKTVTTFFIIGITILLLACINYINLATARSAERSKEVGIRKVLGAFRSDLVRLYVSETLVLTLLSVIGSIVLTPILLPIFNLMSGKNLDFNLSEWLPYMLAIGGVVGIISGIYPALYLSKIKPALILKISKNFHSVDNGFFRKILVVLQYTSTSVLLVGVLTIASQISYLQNKDLGFNSKEILYLDGFDFSQSKNLKRELKLLPEVTDVTSTWAIPSSSQASFGRNLFRTNHSDDTQRMEAFFTVADHNFPSFFEFEVLEGRSFNEDSAVDTLESILVNETFVRQTGWVDNAIGREVELFNMLGASAGKRKIVGILKDFNFQPLHQTIKPLAIGCRHRAGNIAFKLQTETPLETIGKIKSIANAYSNGSLIEVHFLDQDLNSFYQEEVRFRSIINAFTFLACVISCIGLFGLAFYSAQKKSKEIAIRKIMGASTLGILYKLIKEFSMLVLISFLVALPISYVVLGNWLESFPYRINQSPLFYLIALVISLGLSVLTTGFHSFRSARTNPAEVLKED